MSIATTIHRGWARATLVAVIGFGAALGGCNNKNNDLLESNRALTDRNQQLVAELEAKDATIASLQSSMEAAQRTAGGGRDQVSALIAENTRLQQQLAAMDERLKGMAFGSLDPETDAALRALAAQYPDVIEYDQQRGMVRFKSDLTFASGSDECTAAGKQSLDALARVLNSSATLNYDVRVVGHTDSQRISANTAKRHPTNVHLSAHRAISARNELVRMGVQPERVEVAGRGEYLPLVANTSSGNTPQNRRVEIFLVKGMGSRPSVTGPSTSDPVPSPSRPAEDDTVK
jgi:chemotaxis protein MotB